MSVPVLVAFTLAPAPIAPDGSVTVPLMAPRNVWAFPATANSATATKIPSMCLISLLQQNLNILATRWVQLFRITLQLESQSLNAGSGAIFQLLTGVAKDSNTLFG